MFHKSFLGPGSRQKRLFFKQMSTHYIKGLLVFLWAVSFLPIRAQEPFVTVRGHQFMLEGKPWYAIGANYWYGGLVPADPEGKERIRRELDFLRDRGITKLRVMTAAEGTGPINGVPRVEPAYQPEPGVFREELLTGLDFLLAEMNKRKMKAVLYLSNNWEWSGGFLQYLNWNGQIADSVLRRKLSWDEMRDYTSRFYSCDNCLLQYEAQLRRIVTRVNSFTGIKYAEDPAVMSWEIANEPRPMRPAAVEAYRNFIRRTARLIRSLDSRHLITTGSEGEAGSEKMEIFEQVHADPLIDYLTIHIWPKNWGWFKDTAIAGNFPQIIRNTEEYVSKHLTVAGRLNKPLVIEEFGLPRDGHSFSEFTTTVYRDRYYAFLFEKVIRSYQENGPVAGALFWSFSGYGRPSHKQLLWKKGDDILGDPPVEEQGLNSVFDTDSSTWNMIRTFTSQLNPNE